MKQSLARAILVLVILVILPCVGLLASGWDAGDYWVWQGSMEQSPSFTTTTTIYVLQSTRVLYRYELDVLGQVFHANGQTTVTLGTVLRHLGGLTAKGYNSMFQDAARWASLPQGAQAGENWQIPDYPFWEASSKQMTVMQDACANALDPAAESYQLVNELVELGHVSPEEAALLVLSVIDEMKDHSWANPATIFILREQLLSLGLLSDPAP